VERNKKYQSDKPASPFSDGNGDNKRLCKSHTENVTPTYMHGGCNSWNTASVNLPISAEYISVHDSSSGKSSNPGCSPQDDFASSAFKTFVTLSSNN